MLFISVHRCGGFCLRSERERRGTRLYRSLATLLRRRDQRGGVRDLKLLKRSGFTHALRLSLRKRSLITQMTLHLRGLCPLQLLVQQVYLRERRGTRRLHRGARGGEIDLERSCGGARVLLLPHRIAQLALQLGTLLSVRRGSARRGVLLRDEALALNVELRPGALEPLLQGRGVPRCAQRRVVELLARAVRARSRCARRIC